MSERAKEYFSRMYPGGPEPFAQGHTQEHLEEALEFAMNYDVGQEVSVILPLHAYCSPRLISALCEVDEESSLVQRVDNGLRPYWGARSFVAVKARPFLGAYI